MTRLYVTPVELVEANRAVEAWHRHHQPVVGHRFSIGAIDTDGTLRGVAIAGRPVARLTSDRDVLEVTRVATDGTRNACSFLLGAVARIAREMGFRRVQTFTLPEEGGASLRACGWTSEGEAGGGQWVHTDGRPRRTDQPTSIKTRWINDLRPRPDVTVVPEPETDLPPTLFDLTGGVG